MKYQKLIFFLFFQLSLSDGIFMPWKLCLSMKGLTFGTASNFFQFLHELV